MEQYEKRSAQRDKATALRTLFLLSNANYLLVDAAAILFTLCNHQQKQIEKRICLADSLIRTAVENNRL